MTSKAKERKVSIQKDFLFQKMANLFKSWDDPAQILSIHFVENVIPSNSLLPCQQKIDFNEDEDWLDNLKMEKK